MTTPRFGEPAPIARRVVAYIIDALIAGVLPVIAVIVAIAMITGAAGDPSRLADALVALSLVYLLLGLAMLAWTVVYTIMQTRGGSIGMRAQRLNLVNVNTGRPLTFGPALLRNIVFGVTGSFIVGMLSPLFDSSGRGQGWHDKVANAMMLDAAGRPAPVPSSEAPRPVLPNPLASSGQAQSPAPAPFIFPQQAQPAEHPDFPDQTIAAPRPTTPAPPVPPAPVMPPLPPRIPDAGWQAPEPAGAPEETIISPRAQAAAAADPLISFVPGVTQTGPGKRPDAENPQAEPDSPQPQQQSPQPQPAVLRPTPEEIPPKPPLPDSSAPIHADDDDIEATRISIPGHRLVFTWDDGARVTVSGRTIFGRNPDPVADATIVSVRDETLSLSKTHFEAGAEPTGGWVMDRHSTNGMTIVRDGNRIACPAGQRVPVRLGDAIEIGDRIVTIGGFA